MERDPSRAEAIVDVIQEASILVRRFPEIGPPVSIRRHPNANARHLVGAVYAIHVAVTDEVSTADNDEFLELFSHHRAKQGAATWWLQNWLTERTMKQQDV